MGADWHGSWYKILYPKDIYRLFKVFFYLLTYLFISLSLSLTPAARDVSCSRTAIKAAAIFYWAVWGKGRQLLIKMGQKNRVSISNQHTRIGTLPRHLRILGKDRCNKWPLSTPDSILKKEMKRERILKVFFSVFKTWRAWMSGFITHCWTLKT